MNGHMVLASGYPVLGAFLTIVFLVGAAVWLILLFRVISDLFSDDSVSGAGKALWLVFLIFLPFLGVFLYLIARGDKARQPESHRRS
ncbi:PLDc N-terminal domain-containing protein [Streptomyces sp. NBC_00433]